MREKIKSSSLVGILRKIKRGVEDEVELLVTGAVFLIIGIVALLLPVLAPTKVDLPLTAILFALGGIASTVGGVMTGDAIYIVIEKNRNEVPS